ncbi:MAG: transposase [Thermaerobacter sp.]|nr:transposase [Thermaerobacter sp.]
MSFADVDQWWKSIAKNSIWQSIRTWSEAALNDDCFTHWYSNLGRHSVPPSFIIMLMAIQLRQGWSDQEAVDAAQFDDRVKYALGLSRSPEIHCDRSTLCKYRGRFLEIDLDRSLLRHSLEGAATHGLLSNESDIVDSFMVAGAAARQGTLTLIRSAIQQVLRQAKREGLPSPDLHRADYDQKKRPAINWNDRDARAGLLQELVEDADTCRVFYAKDQHPGSEELEQCLKLLNLVATQDVTKDESGTVSITQGTAPDRIISIVDTEMRHGHKTSSAKFDGYKAHIAVQNVAPSEGARLITGVEVTGGNVADGNVAKPLLQERKELTGSMPHEVMGDTAYGSPGVRENIKEVAPDINVTAPVPPSNNRCDLFPKTDFAIDTENHTVTCPAG